MINSTTAIAIVTIAASASYGQACEIEPHRRYTEDLHPRTRGDAGGWGSPHKVNPKKGKQKAQKLARKAGRQGSK